MKKYWSRVFIFFLLLYFNLIGFASAYRVIEGKIRRSEEKSKLTIMVYLGADNNLDSCADDDIEEMLKAKIPEGVSVAVFVDGYSNEDNFRGVIENGKLIRETLDEVDSANPVVLEKFIRWSVDKKPANKYMLILWDHGSGWKNTYKPYSSQDDNGTDNENSDAEDDGESSSFINNQYEDISAVIMDDHSNHEISLQQIRKVLEKVKEYNIHIDILGFDACLMGMAEVIYEVADYVDLVIGSEEVEPGDGWPYDLFLSGLTALDNESIGKLAVSKYIDSYKDNDAGNNVTLSAVDTKKFKEMVLSVLPEYFEYLKDNEWTSANVQNLFSMTQSYMVDDYIDIIDLLMTIKTESSVKIANAVHSTIISNGRLGDSVKRSNGISIYAPQRSILNTYFKSLFSQESGWGEFLKTKISKVEKISYDTAPKRFRPIRPGVHYPPNYINQQNQGHGTFPPFPYK